MGHSHQKANRSRNRNVRPSLRVLVIWAKLGAVSCRLGSAN